jgi:hypothetical protein
MTLDQYIEALEAIRAEHGGSLRMTHSFRRIIHDVGRPSVLHLDTEGKYYLTPVSTRPAWLAEPRGEKVVAV